MAALGTAKLGTGAKSAAALATPLLTQVTMPRLCAAIGLCKRASHASQRCPSYLTHAGPPVCRPIEGLPAWRGGSANQLACAVVTFAKKLGLQHWNQWAYIMATIQLETGARYTPLRECYALYSASYCDSYTARYKGYYGRGYVQITWLANYQKFAVRAAASALPLQLLPRAAAAALLPPPVLNVPRYACAAGHHGMPPGHVP